ncbi:unnamed protein product [Polarella glacialis]|uniref:Uncharacterized protein n=1 Tax=Polarella glacialis TaxID=89957 RepID=A0A813FNU6_POLGL|nr:unnamed protein product [Polarella glacialis]
MIASWSPFSDHYVRVALKTEEGLWVGEQRSMLSSLEIELPAGSYNLIVEEPAMLNPPVQGCTEAWFCLLFVCLTKASLGAAAAATVPTNLGPGLGLGARCDGLGAMPLPLDVISPGGGSASLGGPIDAKGRLLIRERVLLTDIHDGRKKVFMRIPPGSLLRVAVVSGDAEGVEVILEDQPHRPVAAAHSHVLGLAGGSAASYLLESGGGHWLSFHREHRVANGAGCASFDLLMQLAPLNDILQMGDCPIGGVMTLQDLTKKVEDGMVLGESVLADFSTAEGRIASGKAGAATSVFGINLQEPWFIEVELGFNLLLSNVHIWLEEAQTGLRDSAGPSVGPSGLASSPLNAHAVLFLRLPAGRHQIRVHHEPAFPATGAGSVAAIFQGATCAPLRLAVRLLPWQSSAAIVSPSLMAPVTYASDVVVVATTPSGSTPRVPTLGGVLPTASSAVATDTLAAGGVAFAWSSNSLSSALNSVSGQGRPVEAPPMSSKLWALPLRFGDGADAGEGEVWIMLEPTGRCRPWAGETGPLYVGPQRLWPGAGIERLQGLDALRDIIIPSLPPILSQNQQWLRAPARPRVSLLPANPGVSSQERSFLSYSLYANLLCWLVPIVLVVLYSIGFRLPPQVVHFIGSLPAKIVGERAAAAVGELTSVVEFAESRGSATARLMQRSEVTERIGRVYGASTSECCRVVVDVAVVIHCCCVCAFLV